MNEKQESTSQVNIAGWACWIAGLLLGTNLQEHAVVWAPLFLAAIVLGVITMRRVRAGEGVAMIVVSVVAPVAIYTA